jgi:hypothetical protein
MKSKLLKQLREEAKENVYLKNYYCEDGKDILTIICVKEGINEDDIIKYFYNSELDVFETVDTVNYGSVEEALPYLKKARYRYIMDEFRMNYQTYSKGEQKKIEKERIKQQEYQKYLQQF